MPPAPQSPLGLFATQSSISEEDRAIQDTVRRFVEDRVKPEVAEWYETGSVPVRDLARELGSLGGLGMHLEGSGCAGAAEVHQLVIGQALTGQAVYR